jgi:toxin-antitoxin system PIN domain toxin
LIAVDTNILVYAHRGDSDWHKPAAGAVKRLAEGSSLWAIPWPCLHEFLAIVTHPRIYLPPTPINLAAEQIRAWLESPTLILLSEDKGYWQTLDSLVNEVKIKGAQIHDARIAALCLRGGVVELWSADRDFSRFAQLNVRNPLLVDRGE